MMDNIISLAQAADMLGVSRGRASQLADRGQLEVVTIGGRKMVVKQSVMDRIESNPTAGRPRK